MIASILFNTFQNTWQYATEAEKITANYFTPLHYVLYLGIIFVLMVVYYMWRWYKDCRDNILLLVIESDGSTTKKLVPKESSSVTIKNPKTEAAKTWAINELATVEMLYPGVSFVPEFMQKKIKLAIVDVMDYEPVLNRSTYKERVASPDVKVMLQKIVELIPDSAEKISMLEFIKSLKSAPTKNLIASPSVLGNLIHEKVTEAVIKINKEMIDFVSSLTKKLDKIPNAMIVYIGLGLNVVLIVVTLFFVKSIGSSDNSQILKDIQLIKQSLGIP